MTNSILLARNAETITVTTVRNTGLATMTSGGLSLEMTLAAGRDLVALKLADGWRVALCETK